MKEQPKNESGRLGRDTPLSSSAAFGGGTRQGGRRHRWLPILLWAVFGTGLILQTLGPRLDIVNRAFVMSPSLFSEGKVLNPAEIISRERTKQAWSVVLTVSGALGAAFYYRRILLTSLRAGDPTCPRARNHLPSESSVSRAEKQTQPN
jgi:hypothetical protein